MTGGAQVRLSPSLDSLFLLFVCPFGLQKSSSVPSVFKKVRLSRLFLLTLLWVDRLFCKTPPVILRKMLYVRGLDEC